MSRRITLVELVLSLSILTIVGCAGKVDVTGKVTHKGKTVVWGTVTLVDGSGAYYQGSIDLNGQYALSKVPTGTVKIAVHTSDPHTSRGGRGGGGPKTSGAGSADDPRSKFKTDAEAEPPRPEKGKWFPLPTKFADPQTSGLTGEVSRGTPLDIDIP